LENWIGTGLEAFDKVAWGEGGLLDLCEVVGGILCKNEFADFFSSGRPSDPNLSSSQEYYI